VPEEQTLVATEENIDISKYAVSNRKGKQSQTNVLMKQIQFV
jgi:hypothetical protein